MTHRRTPDSSQLGTHRCVKKEAMTTLNPSFTTANEKLVKVCLHFDEKFFPHHFVSQSTIWEFCHRSVIDLNLNLLRSSFSREWCEALSLSVVSVKKSWDSKFGSNPVIQNNTRINMTFVCFLQIFGIAVIRHVFGDKNWQTIWLLHRAQMSQFLLVKTNPDLINSFC